MRFVFAIVAFAAAAVMIGFGIAQRTVFLEPDRVVLGTVVEDQADYVVLQPDALAAHEGKQTITVSGSDVVFIAYGRSSDVEAWVGDAPYVSVGYDAEAEDFTSEVVVAHTGDAKATQGGNRGGEAPQGEAAAGAARACPWPGASAPSCGAATAGP